MYFQQKMTAPKNPNAPVTDQQRQQKMMGNIMTIVFTVLFYHFPSGLNIYWLFSMILGILQQWWTTRKMRQTKAVNSTTVDIQPEKSKK
jgi:YidC/Oxa1 family membrane protein insertase